VKQNRGIGGKKASSSFKKQSLMLLLGLVCFLEWKTVVACQISSSGKAPIFIVVAEAHNVVLIEFLKRPWIDN